MTYGFPCFSKDTLIMTDKGYKKIKDINKNDNVLTHMRRFEKVENIMQKKVNNYFLLKALGQPKTKVTAEHPYYVRKMYKEWNNNKRVYERKFTQAKWKKVKNLKRNNYIGFPINNKEELPIWNGVKYKNGVWKKYKTKNELIDKFNNKNFWWIIGRYIGDGWYQKIKRKNRKNSFNRRVIICCNKNNSEVNDIREKLEDLYSYNLVEERTVYKFHIINMELVEWIKQFGKGAKNKKLTSDILNLPIKYLKSFLEGYISADGYINQKDYIRMSTISKELAYGLQYAIHKAYKQPTKIYYTKTKDKTNIEGRVVNQSNRYDLVFKKKNKKQDRAFFENGYIWTPIKKIKQIQNEIFVYNLKVRNDNSYTANNVAVHNCNDISIAGNKKGFDKDLDTKSSLLWYAMNIAKNKKPKYMIAENVKHLVSSKFKNDFNNWLKYLKNIGYNKTYWKILNARDFNIPQNRERVFVISIREDVNKEFDFPKNKGLKTSFRNVLQYKFNEKYIITKEAIKKIKEHNDNTLYNTLPNMNKIKKYHELEEGKQYITLRDKGKWKIRNTDYITCLDANYYKGIDNHSARTAITDTNIIRRLTPLECWRFMGFEDKDYWKGRFALEKEYYYGNERSDTRMYKMAGNSIVVPILEEIFKKLFKEGN